MIEVKPEISNRKCYCCGSSYKVVFIEFKGNKYGDFISLCEECVFDLIGELEWAYKEDLPKREYDEEE